MIYDLASHNCISLSISEILHVKQSQLNDWVTWCFIRGGSIANGNTTLVSDLTFNYLPSKLD